LVNESSTDVKVIGNYGQEEVETIVEDGIDLSDYYPSVEWDIMGTQVIKIFKLDNWTLKNKYVKKGIRIKLMTRKSRN